jgi:phosphohistidine phosphatase SixA
MKYLFLARHGDYDKNGTGDLTELGKKEIETLGEAIGEILGENTSVELISSLSPRAVQSSEIIVVRLGLPPEFQKVPNLYAPYPEDLKQMSARLDETEETSAIIMAHSPFVELYSKQFLREKEFENPQKIRVGSGQAVYFNPEQKEYRTIP